MTDKGPPMKEKGRGRRGTVGSLLPTPYSLLISCGSITDTKDKDPIR